MENGSSRKSVREMCSGCFFNHNDKCGLSHVDTPIRIERAESGFCGEAGYFYQFSFIRSSRIRIINTQTDQPMWVWGKRK